MIISLIQKSEEVKRGFANVGESSKGIQKSEDLKTAFEVCQKSDKPQFLLPDIGKKVRFNPQK